MIEVPLNANQIFAGTDKCVNIRLINVKYDINILNDTKQYVYGNIKYESWYLNI